MEGDVLGLLILPESQISTHALTWRATSHLSHFGGSIVISTHALTWRATSYHTDYAILSIFLPTPSHGGRLILVICRSPSNHFYPRPHMEGDSKHAEVQACISAAYLKCSTRKAAASSRRAGLGGKAVLFHQFPHLVLGRARCEPRGEGMCDRGSHRQSGRKWFKLTAIKCHPGSTEGPGRCVPPCFYSGCPADKSAGCPSEDRSAQ